jgi:hypothetical protein
VTNGKSFNIHCLSTQSDEEMVSIEEDVNMQNAEIKYNLSPQVTHEFD